MAHLNARPLRRCAPPRYPTKREALADPDLLKKHVPLAWLGSREIGGMLGIALAVHATGCRSGSTAGTGAGTSGPPAVVAPLFRHGDGQAPGDRRGMLGCIAVAAPTFLAEEEAILVVEEELAKAGVNLVQKDVAFPEVVFSGKEPFPAYDWVNGCSTTGYRPVRQPLVVDRVDPGKRVAVEYLSQADFCRFGGDPESEQVQDLQLMANVVRREVSTHVHGTYFGTFYDPVRYHALWSGEAGDRWADSPASARTEAKQLLRAQVQDFVAWLKGQGVI